MLTKQFKNALKIVSDRLSINDVKWAVVGSTNMALQGINVNPQDLDVAMRLEDLEKIPSIFSDMGTSDISELSSMTDEPAWEVNMKVGEVDVQMFGEHDSGQYISKLLAGRITGVVVDETKVPCLTLEAEADAYAETNRQEKAKIIKKFLGR